MVFYNRKQAGSYLADELSDYGGGIRSVVLGLPRGGVVVAEEIARKLGLPLDVILIRKLPYPAQPELAVGAVAEDGTVLVNPAFQKAAKEDPSWLEDIVREQLAVIRKRAAFYQSHRRGRDLKGKTVILVDDGIATGATIKVAVRSVRSSDASKVVVAVPVAAPSSIRELRAEADEVICLEAPDDFFAVGQAYQDFGEVSDEEVISILDRNP